MTILDYYINKLTDINWVQEFQSTAQDKHGKIFNCLNVNFRSLNSYYGQLDAFKDKDGLRRSEWNDYQDNGQEKDKHRVPVLKNAKFLKMEEDKFLITVKGKVTLSINENNNLRDREKWILMYMLLLDFEFDGVELDIVKSVLELSADLGKFDITATKLIEMLKGYIFNTDKIVFFKSDIFWLISFAKDKDFINLYLSSTKEEKEQLFNRVIRCSKDSRTDDCIAHKFKSGGAYSGKMFNEDVNIILCTLILVTLQDKNYDNFVNLTSKLYEPLIRANVIKDIIKENFDIFDETYSNSIGKINELLNVED